MHPETHDDVLGLCGWWSAGLATYLTLLGGYALTSTAWNLVSGPVSHVFAFCCNVTYFVSTQYGNFTAGSPWWVGWVVTVIVVMIPISFLYSWARCVALEFTELDWKHGEKDFDAKLEYSGFGFETIVLIPVTFAGLTEFTMRGAIASVIGGNDRSWNDPIFKHSVIGWMTIYPYAWKAHKRRLERETNGRRNHE